MELSEALRRLSEGAPILVYGEGGAGKTTLIAVMLAEEAREGHYVAYAYTGDVGLYRFKRVFEVNAPPRQLALIKIASFWEQDRLVDALYRARGGGLRAIAIDTVTEAYRLHVAVERSPLEASKLLNQQLAMLADLADEEGLTVVLSSRARRLVEDLEPEASSILEYWSRATVRIERLPRPGFRRIVVEKGPSEVRGEVFEVSIHEGGFKP